MGMPVIELQPLDRDQALNSVLASIALQEAALSHIINADGEKLQMAIKLRDPGDSTDDPLLEAGALDSDSLEDLLGVNDSVGDLMDVVNSTERVIRCKMYDVLNFINPNLDLPAIVMPVSILVEDGAHDPVQGAVFGVFDSDADLETDDPLFQSVSDVYGRVSFRLPDGDYTITQVAAPDGYASSAQTVDFTVDACNNTVNGRVGGRDFLTFTNSVVPPPIPPIRGTLGPDAPKAAAPKTPAPVDAAPANSANQRTAKRSSRYR